MAGTVERASAGERRGASSNPNRRTRPSGALPPPRPPRRARTARVRLARPSHSRRRRRRPGSRRGWRRSGAGKAQRAAESQPPGRFLRRGRGRGRCSARPLGACPRPRQPPLLRRLLRLCLRPARPRSARRPGPAPRGAPLLVRALGPSGRSRRAAPEGACPVWAPEGERRSFPTAGAEKGALAPGSGCPSAGGSGCLLPGPRPAPAAPAPPVSPAALGRWPGAFPAAG